MHTKRGTSHVLVPLFYGACLTFRFTLKNECVFCHSDEGGILKSLPVKVGDSSFGTGRPAASE